MSDIFIIHAFKIFRHKVFLSITISNPVEKYVAPSRHHYNTRRMRYSLIQYQNNIIKYNQDIEIPVMLTGCGLWIDIIFEKIHV